MKNLALVWFALLPLAAHGQDFRTVPWIGPSNVATTAMPVNPGTCEEAVCRLCNGNMCGSGTNIDKSGLVITCAHVVGAEGQKIVLNFPNKKSVAGIVVTCSFEDDLALVSFDNSGLNVLAVPLAAQNPPAGEVVWTIGYPGNHGFTCRKGTVVDFVLAQHDGAQPINWLRASCWIQSGDSGGAVITSKGELAAVQSNVLTNGDNRCLARDMTHIKRLFERRKRGSCPDCPGGTCPKPEPAPQPQPVPIPAPNQEIADLKKQLDTLTTQFNALKLQHGKDGERGPIGPPGPKGADGKNADVQELTTRIAVLESRLAIVERAVDVKGVLKFQVK